jgi:hypothetical protein
MWSVGIWSHKFQKLAILEPHSFDYSDYYHFSTPHFQNKQSCLCSRQRSMNGQVDQNLFQLSFEGWPVSLDLLLLLCFFARITDPRTQTAAHKQAVVLLTKHSRLPCTHAAVFFHRSLIVKYCRADL